MGNRNRDYLLCIAFFKKVGNDIFVIDDMQDFLHNGR